MSDSRSLDKDKFSSFMDMLGIVAKSCDDMMIKDGYICQTSNKRQIIFEIDMRYILGDISFNLSAVAPKEKILNTFKKQGVAMDIIIEDDAITFKDNESHIACQPPHERYIANKFIEQSALQTKLNIDPNGHILNYEIGRHLVDRITVVSENLVAINLKVDFEGDKAVFKIRPTDNNNSTVFKLMELHDLEQPITGSAGFSIEPFYMNVNSFDAEIWKTLPNSSGAVNVLMKLKTFIDSEQNIPMTIWCFSPLTTDNELV